MCQACPLLSRRPIPVEIRPLIHKRQLQTGYAFDETWCLPGPNPAAGRPRAGALLSRAPSHVAHAHPTDHAAQHVAGRLVESTRRSHTAPHLHRQTVARRAPRSSAAAAASKDREREQSAPQGGLPRHATRTPTHLPAQLTARRRSGTGKRPHAHSRRAAAGSGRLNAAADGRCVHVPALWHVALCLSVCLSACLSV